MLGTAALVRGVSVFVVEVLRDLLAAPVGLCRSPFSSLSVSSGVLDIVFDPPPSLQQLVSVSSLRSLPPFLSADSGWHLLSR